MLKYNEKSLYLNLYLSLHSLVRVYEGKSEAAVPVRTNILGEIIE